MAASFYVRFVDGEIFRCFVLTYNILHFAQGYLRFVVGEFRFIRRGFGGALRDGVSSPFGSSPDGSGSSAGFGVRSASARFARWLRSALVKNLGKILHFPP